MFKPQRDRTPRSKATARQAACLGATLARIRQIGIVLSGLIASAFVVVTPTLGETIKGTFRFADAHPTSGAVQLRPIAFAKVEIWRSAPPLGIWNLEATTTTNANGSFSQPMNFVANGVIYGVKVFATNEGATVWPNDALHIVPFHREPGQPGAIINQTVASISDELDFSFDFADADSSQHFNLAETVQRGFDYARARRDPAETDALPRANVQPTSAIGSWYNPVFDTVVINSSHVFEDFLILHEYAHFLEEQISSFGWMATIHDGCEARDGLGNVINSAEHAWMEGFANYFSRSVQLMLPPGTFQGSSNFGTLNLSELENQPSPCPSLAATVTGDMIEKRVAGTLWDLFDQPGDPATASEAHDTITRKDIEIFQIFDRELDVYGGGPTISQFHNAWTARGFDHPALDRIFVKHGIPEPADSAHWGEPGDVPVPRDYNGNGKIDAAVWRPSTGMWYTNDNETDAIHWGEPGDVPVPGDYNGNGKIDAAVWRPSTGMWYTNDNETDAIHWGEPGDVPVPGDYNGNGKIDAAVWRPSTGMWYINDSETDAIHWGEPGDVPVPGDYNGNGKIDAAVWRPSTGMWYINDNETDAIHWGEPGDVPVPGDYNGNGKIDAAVWRPSTGMWYINDNETDAIHWGEPGDVPVPGDYNGNGKIDAAVWRPSAGIWYIRE